MEILDILQREWPLIAAAPVIAMGGALIVFLAAFTVAWKLKSAIDEGQINARNGQIDALNERLLLAKDR